jgi:hypothetical protein
MQLLKNPGPIDYDLEVWCKRCSKPYLRVECEFRERYGWKCPACGNKCRDKKKHKNPPYVPYKRSVNIKTWVKRYAKARKGVE